MRNLANFDPTLESLNICFLMVSFWAQIIFCLSWKNTDELCAMTLKDDTTFKEKLAGGFKNDKEFD